MNGPFSVGELVDFRVPPHLIEQTLIANGTEVEIIEGAGTYMCQDGHGNGVPGPIFGYVVAYRHWKVIVEPQYLFRRRPPIAYTGEQRIRALFVPAPVKELEPA